MFRNQWQTRRKQIQTLLLRAPSFAYRTIQPQQSLTPHLYYMIPDANWVTDWIAHYLTEQLKEQFSFPAHVSTTPHLLRGHILHYGELGAFLAHTNGRFNQENKIIVTLFHGHKREDPTDPLTQNINQFLAHLHLIDKVHTACQIMHDRLLDWGVPQEKIALIPFGIDLTHFFPAPTGEKERIRQQLAIPSDAFCIGSFQKDGNGWGEGLEPKWVKGPDIFLETVAHLKSEIPNLFILLTGPARGYIKKGLAELQIPYRHDILSHYPDIVSHYHALDAYLVSSREEGGPKAVLESLATGIPLVTTAVGFAPDLIHHQENGLIHPIEDSHSLASSLLHLYKNPTLGTQFRTNGLKTIQSYAWPIIAQRYYEQLYAPLRK